MGEQLASLGYIVAAPVHTDGSAGERFKGFYPFEKPVVNAQLAERARDVSFTVDQLQNESEYVLFRIFPQHHAYPHWVLTGHQLLSQNHRPNRLGLHLYLRPLVRRRNGH
jgi:hypothetical protein